MYLVIDTETNGLPQYRDKATGEDIAAEADGQPRLASFAMIRCAADLTVESTYHAYVRPADWEMTPETTALNGLTTEFLNEHGFPISEVLTEYQNAILEGRTVIAYGSRFDTKIMRGELRRAGKDALFEQTPTICVMQACMGVVKKPDGGRGWPKLEHACAHFGIPLSEKHRAPEDAEAARLIAHHLQNMGKLPEGRVHFSKNKKPDSSTNT